MSTFVLRTLGSLALLRDGVVLDAVAGQRKGLALLAVIAASGDAGIGRERLMALFWPESDAERARGALKQMLYVLRRHLGGSEAIRGTADLRLDDALVGSDVVMFRGALARGDLEEGVRLYTGPFLDGVHVDAAPEFERWVDAERAALARGYQEGLEQLARVAAVHGDHQRAVHWWRRLQEADRLSGHAARGLMEALDAAGDRAAALQHARIHELLLREEIGAEPDPSVVKLAEHLRSSPVVLPPRMELRSGTVRAPNEGAAADVPLEHPSVDPFSASAAAAVPRRRIASALPLVGFAALAMAILLATRFGSGTTPPLDEQRVAVGVFVNRTGDERLDAIGTMAADWLTRGIAHAAVADVVDVGLLYVQGRTSSGAPTEPRRLAREHGAGVVIAGNYYQSGDSLYFSTSIVDVASGRLLRMLSPVGGTTADPLPAIDEIRQRVTSALASLTDPSAGTIPGLGAHPPRYAAYQEFVAGQGVYWRGGFQESMTHFRRALELDSSFASAALWLGVAAVGVMRCDVVDSVHLALAPQLERLTEAERLTRGITAARCDTNPEEEHRLQRARALRSATSSFYGWTVAMSASKARRPAEAVAVLRTIDPERDLGWLSDPAFYWRELGGAQHALSDHRAELRSAERFARVGPQRLAASYFTARALAGAGRPDAALHALEGVEDLQPDPVLVAGQVSSHSISAQRLATPGWVLYHAATELLAHGYPGPARVAAARSVAWSNSRPPEAAAAPEHRWVLARALALLGQYAHATALATSLVEGDSASIDFRGTLGVIAASAGDASTAQSIDNWLTARPAGYPAGLPVLYRARIAAALGEHERALTLLEGLPHRAHPQAEPSLFHNDPAFIPLRDHPRFRVFVRPRR